MPSKLVFLPLTSAVAYVFSSTFPVASKLLSREMRQCLTHMVKWLPLTSPYPSIHTCTYAIFSIVIVQYTLCNNCSMNFSVDAYRFTITSCSLGKRKRALH